MALCMTLRPIAQTQPSFVNPILHVLIIAIIGSQFGLFKSEEELVWTTTHVSANHFTKELHVEHMLVVPMDSKPMSAQF
jgi:hypothetical protein